MSNLKELRGRIDSVKQTRKITSAMKLVAASKLKRAQDLAAASRPYTEKMSVMMANLCQSVKDSPSAPALLAGTGSDQKHLIIVATADRGLCGGFNSSIVRATRQRILSLQAEGKDVALLCVGRKGSEQLKREFGALFVDSIEGIGKKTVQFSEASDISARALSMFENGEFDVCTLVYNRFVSAINQVVTFKQLIPAESPETEDEGSGASYEYEPEEESLLAELLPRNVSVQIFSSLVENAASEQGARMTAMDNATRNAGDMIKNLTLTYNRSRQAQITKELIEIISGAEAV